MQPSRLSVVSSTQGYSGIWPSRLVFALWRNFTSASVRSCEIYGHERGATKRGKWGMSTRCERAQRNMLAQPGEVRIVELASLRGTPSRAERLVGLAGEIRMKLALHLLELVLLCGRFLERPSHFSLLLPSAWHLPLRVYSCPSDPMQPCASILSSCPVAALRAASSDLRLTFPACPVAAFCATSTLASLS